MTNRELDALVAEKVMGWTSDAVDDSGNCVVWLVDDGSWSYDLSEWCPSEDWSCMKEVVEQMREKGWAVRMQIEERGAWAFWMRHYADTLPRAVCEAALKAVGDET